MEKKYEECFDTVFIDNDSGDYAFIDNRYINDHENTYNDLALRYSDQSFNVYKGDNEIVFDRYDRHNPKRRSNKIHINKTCGCDCYFETECKVKYSYVYLSGSFMFERAGTNTYLFLLDDKSGAEVKTIDVLRVTKNMELYALDKYIRGIALGEVFDVEVCVDLKEHTLCVWYNGEKAVENLRFDAKLGYASNVTTGIVNEEGETGLTIDNYKIIGMKKPYLGNGLGKSTVFPPDDGYISYLKEKIAFHTYVDNITINGTDKYYAETPSFYDSDTGEYYIADKSFAYAFSNVLTEEEAKEAVRCMEEEGTSVKAGERSGTLDYSPVKKNGKLYIPVKSFAQNILGMYTADDGVGMILLSHTPIRLDFDNEQPEYMRDDCGWDADLFAPESVIKGLNMYLLFQRPSKERLEKQFSQRKGAEHPRIIATPERLESIKRTISQNSLAKEYFENIIEKADSYIGNTKLWFDIQGNLRLLRQSRDMLYSTERLAFAYIMTGDNKYKDYLWKQLEIVLNFPDWNPSHIIDTAEMLMAVTIAYDWLYNDWKDSERKAMEEAMLEKAIIPINSGYYGWLCGGRMIASGMFAKWKSNFNTVTNGAVVAGALALADKYPEICFDTVEKAIRSMEYTIRCFPKEGTWLEGNAYWDYTVSYLSKFVESLKTVYDDDFGIVSTPGVRNAGRFLVSMIGHTSINNYHDTGMYDDDCTANLTWYAYATDDPALFTFRQKDIKQGIAIPNVYDMLFWPSSSEAGYEGIPLEYYGSGLESFMMRDGFEDKNGFYFVSHAGPVNYYHSQIDVGTFVLDMLGERWASELGREDYLFINKGGYGMKEIFLRRAESHSVMIFDPGEDIEQDWDGFAPAVCYKANEACGYVIYDMSDVYKNHVTSYQRGFFIGDNRTTLTVRDEVLLKNENVTAYWFLQTLAKVTINPDGKGAVLCKNSKKMYFDLLVEGADEYELMTTEAKPLPTSPQIPGQTDNSQFTRITVVIKGSGNITVSARLSPVLKEFKPVKIEDWMIKD